MGVYGLAWTPAFIFETIWTLGQNFGFKVPLALNLKIAIFQINLMGVYGLAWTSAFIFLTIWTLGPNFGSKGPLALN